jgi:hypothetical protein
LWRRHNLFDNARVQSEGGATIKASRHLWQVLKSYSRDVILSEAKDLFCSFSGRYSRCFAALSMTGFSSLPGAEFSGMKGF